MTKHSITMSEHEAALSTARSLLEGGYTTAEEMVEQLERVLGLEVETGPNARKLSDLSDYEEPLTPVARP